MLKPKGTTPKRFKKENFTRLGILCFESKNETLKKSGESRIKDIFDF
jgi:hypothetical protein